MSSFLFVSSVKEMEAVCSLIFSGKLKLECIFQGVINRLWDHSEITNPSCETFSKSATSNLTNRPAAFAICSARLGLHSQPHGPHRPPFRGGVGAPGYLEQLHDARTPRSLKSHVATPFGTSFFGVPSLELLDLLETKRSCEGGKDRRLERNTQKIEKGGVFFGTYAYWGWLR